MPVKLNIVRTAPPPQIEAPLGLKMRDTRPDPMGPASRALLAAQVADRKAIKAAFDEFLTPLNRMAYYLDYARWYGVAQRHLGLLAMSDKADKVSINDVHGLVKQLWTVYTQTMKTGVFDKRWGDEPKCAVGK